MIRLKQALLTIDDQEYSLTPGKINSFDHFYVQFDENQPVGSLAGWLLFLHPKQDIILNRVELRFAVPETWIQQHWYHKPAFSAEAPHWQTIHLGHRDAALGLFPGDPSASNIPHGNGIYHSWNWAWIGNEQQHFLLGSLNEHTGLTLFTLDVHQKSLTVRKDLLPGGLLVNHSFPLLELGLWKGENTRALSQYLNAVQWPEVPEETAPILIWEPTSYNTSDTIQQQIDLLESLNLPFTHVHSALLFHTRLRRSATYAPFIVPLQQQWTGVRQEWLVQQNNKIVEVHIPEKGPCGVLDVFHSGVKEYIFGQMHQILDRDRTDLLVIDHLSVCAAYPSSREKTRGQYTMEVYRLLKEAAGNHPLIFKNATLPNVLPHFISQNIAASALPELKKSWWRKRHRNPEVFWPDQSLRQAGQRVDGGSFSLKPLSNRRETHWQFTQLLWKCLWSDVLFTQDHPWEYTPEERADLDEVLFWRGSRVGACHIPVEGVWRVDISRDGHHAVVWTNLNSQPVQVPDSQHAFVLEAFESLIV